MLISVLWFSYLVASMALQVLWSLGLACLDIYALSKKRDLQNKLLVRLFVVGDWVCHSSLKLFSHPLWLMLCLVYDWGRIPAAEINPNLNVQLTATLSLAAASSSSGIAILFVRDFHFCTVRWGLPCGSYKLAVSFTFVTWILTSISFHVMFWILSALV